MWERAPQLPCQPTDSGRSGRGHVVRRRPSGFWPVWRAWCCCQTPSACCCPFAAHCLPPPLCPHLASPPQGVQVFHRPVHPRLPPLLGWDAVPRGGLLHLGGAGWHRALVLLAAHLALPGHHAAGDNAWRQRQAGQSPPGLPPQSLLQPVGHVGPMATRGSRGGQQSTQLRSLQGTLQRTLWTTPHGTPLHRRLHGTLGQPGGEDHYPPRGPARGTLPPPRTGQRPPALPLLLGPQSDHLPPRATPSTLTMGLCLGSASWRGGPGWPSGGWCRGHCPRWPPRRGPRPPAAPGCCRAGCGAQGGPAPCAEPWGSGAPRGPRPTAPAPGLGSVSVIFISRLF